MHLGPRVRKAKHAFACRTFLSGVPSNGLPSASDQRVSASRKKPVVSAPSAVMPTVLTTVSLTSLLLTERIIIFDQYACDASEIPATMNTRDWFQGWVVIPG